MNLNLLNLLVYIETCADFSMFENGNERSGANLDDPNVSDAFALWFAKVSRGMTTSKKMDMRKGYAAMLDSIIVENIDSRAAAFRKAKIPPKYFRSLQHEFGHSIRDNEFNIFFLRDLTRCINQKAEFYNYAVVLLSNEKPVPEYYDVMRIYKMGYPSTQEDFASLSTMSSSTSTVHVSDYAYVMEPKRIKMFDSRNFVSRDYLWSNLEMTSGYVPPSSSIDYSKLKGNMYVKEIGPRPIVMKFSTVPDPDLRLMKSERAYEKRVKERNEYGDGGKGVDGIFHVRFYDEVVKRERSLSESSEEEERNKKICLGSCRPSAMRDEKFIHTIHCPDSCFDLTPLEKCERLWFINKLKGADFKNEFDWLDAEVRRFMSDEYHFESCLNCGEAYSVLNFMKMSYSGSTPAGIIDKMLKFCSYTCFSECVAYHSQAVAYDDLRNTTFDRMQCSACSKITYSFCEPGNSWRCLDYFYGKVNTGQSERLPVCSDECFIYLTNKIHEKNEYKRSFTNLCIFSFYTCVACSKTLLPTKKMCHFRNFPRLPWAFCCYDASCISVALYMSMPMDPRKDHYFLAPSIPIPFDRLGKNRGDEHHADVLRAFNVKLISSGSGGRFILSILE